MIATYGCFESGDTEVVVVMDGNEAGYADFKEGKRVWTVPNVPLSKTFHSLMSYEYAKLTLIWCMERMKFRKGAVPSIPQVKGKSDSLLECLHKPSTIYPRDEEELGVENTLIYSVNHFFPSSVKVNWTNNSLEVTEGASLSWCNLTKDGTFHQFSTLSFTPQKGDFYACTVAHTALKDPKTRFWGVGKF
ncbi:unnamed protein product [Coregonus sp. 'balchen']|nr:unnamed protein product [Coregonus sp. 'balchen']